MSIGFCGSGAVLRAAFLDALASGRHAFAWPWQGAHRCPAALAVGADAFALACDGSWLLILGVCLLQGFHWVLIFVGSFSCPFALALEMMGHTT